MTFLISSLVIIMLRLALYGIAEFIGNDMMSRRAY